MGVYTEYLDKKFGFDGLSAERKKQLERISEIRQRDVLVFAADLNKGRSPISIGYPDLLPIQDQIANLTGDRIDLVLETPGGSGEAAEDIVRILRHRFESVSVVVPGWAKSAGTIIAMSGDELLMGPLSGLGPIDAQLSWQGKVFSADALLEGLEKIKEEVCRTGELNKAYIPILQGISPGEMQSAQNALDFAKVLVTQWLAKYKFSDWTHHRTTNPGTVVTEGEKKKRASEIADALCDHKRWLTHGRSIKLDDLEDMRLEVTDYSKDPDLHDAVTRYYTLLQMTFQTNIYKVFETPVSQIYRFETLPVPPPAAGPAPASVAIAEVPCSQCKRVWKVQANLGKVRDLQKGCVPFPEDDILRCADCGAETDLGDVRRQLEAQTKRPIVQQELA